MKLKLRKKANPLKLKKQKRHQSREEVVQYDKPVPCGAWDLVKQFYLDCQLRTLEGWRMYCDTPKVTKDIAARSSIPKRPKKGFGDLERFLRLRYQEVFGKSAPADADWRLLMNALSYELQYRGFEQAGVLHRITKDVRERREAALQLSWAAMSPKQANLLRYAYWQPESEGGSTMASNKKERKQTEKQERTFAKSSGKTLGLGIVQTWASIFQKNATCAKSERMTDDQISAFMHKEFPDRKAKDFDRVQRVRSWYNRGGAGEAPKVPSVPYDKEGNAIEVKRGRRTTAQVPKPSKGGKKITLRKRPAAKRASASA